MGNYQGYDIIKTEKTGRWEIFWKGKPVVDAEGNEREVSFASQVEAEDWIDEQFPSHRF